MPAPKITSEMLANEFVNYLFVKYKGNRHVRRVASWIGFIVKGIERVADTDLAREQTRQIKFEYRGRQFKVKYNHDIGGRGGVQIIEVLAGRGAPEGQVVANITNLAAAEETYLTLEKRLKNFVAANPASA